MVSRLRSAGKKNDSSAQEPAPRISASRRHRGDPPTTHWRKSFWLTVDAYLCLAPTESDPTTQQPPRVYLARRFARRSELQSSAAEELAGDGFEIASSWLYQHASIPGMGSSAPRVDERGRRDGL